MKSVNRKAELVAPAGNLQKLKVAVEYGADAVYLGGRRFSLRARSENFTPSEMTEGLSYARARNVRVYVLLNVFPHNRHLDEMRAFLEYLGDLRPDAFVVSDIGAFEVAREIAPLVPVHISTQANVTNWRTARFWQEMGASRLILARELSLQEIEEIAARVEVDLEIFVHGAMCMAYSGRCFLSRHLTGRDANLGDCSQSCRWKYRVVEETRPAETFEVEEHPEGTFIFSSRDLCMIEHLPAVLQSGVYGLKIEGRMKSVYYLGITTRTYRMALDRYHASPADYAPDPELVEELRQTGNREFTTGFYLGEMQDGRAPAGGAERKSVRSFVGLVTGSDDGRATVEVRGQIRRGDTLEAIQPKADSVRWVVDSMFGENGQPVEIAQPNSVIHLPIHLQTFSLLRK
ncbi:MAG: U32 family peptidase [Candidatus Abyssobacteria bacterium SURF_5]|uniref:U32 family peptidase n=1 Tax=Abyssobacteria bacterium (strain SURF_5) TaxID=2093360 RepID=A0A3A4P032_ABYX5|nr:MAG: U32 family peptidase [Candidatus Abyssubacteria bacterium SURF_5]